MGTIYLVRHGQASFGAEAYDRLGALAQQQSMRLGEYFQQQEWTFDTVLTLRRHQKIYIGIREGMDASFTAGLHQGMGAPLLWPGLNKYDSEPVIDAIHPNTVGEC